MKLFISICAFIFIILSSQVGLSQKEIVDGDNKYLLYEVKKGETTYGICTKFKITQAELKTANPEMTSGLKSGATIKIPIKSGLSSAKQVNEVSETEIPGNGYTYHKVFKKQTIFSIARQYNITANELIKYNPILKKGLISGTVLKIPVKVDTPIIASTNNKAIAESVSYSKAANKIEGDYTIHTVVAGETLYKLENTYGVKREELINLNPSLANGLQTGLSIRIPRREKQTESENIANEKNSTFLQDDNIECIPIAGRNNQLYKVALLLPFHIQGNGNVQPSQLSEENLLSSIDFSKITNQWFTDSQDSSVQSNSTIIDPKAESFLEFYEGALLAIDSLKKQGMNIELCVFDASNQNMINTLLQMEVFRSLDLIIGPIYPELQERVASFAAKNRIPMVSPLANTGNFEDHNPYYIKVNPSREYQLDQTTGYIANEFKNSNFVLLKINGNSNSTEAKLAEQGKQRLLAMNSGNINLFHEYNFQQQGLHAIKNLLDENGENIFMIPSDNEAQVSVAVTNLNALAEKYNIVLMGTSGFPKMKSIQTENYHHIRLRYSSSTYVDYNKPLVQRFISNYRDVFSGEPTQFSFQGFDVSYYFVSALYKYGKNFKNCLTEYPMELTQTTFNYKKVTPMGGYMNTSLFITSFERNFDIINLGTIKYE